MNRNKLGLPTNRENFIPLESEWLNNQVIRAAMSSASSFKNLAVTLSGPGFRFEFDLFLSDFMSNFLFDFVSNFLSESCPISCLISCPILFFCPISCPIFVSDLFSDTMSNL